MAMIIIAYHHDRRYIVFRWPPQDTLFIDGAWDDDECTVAQRWATMGNDVGAKHLRAITHLYAVIVIANASPLRMTL